MNSKDDSLTRRQVAGMIEHTLLKPQATREQIRRLCREALQWHFHGVCVNPVFTSLAAAELKGSPVAICTVIGFPLGATTTRIKAAEAAQAVADGATELDMVMAIGMLKAGELESVQADISQVVRAAAGVPVKVILESACLTDDEIVVACRLARAAGARFVKSSTGFGPGGAVPEKIALMRQAVGADMGVKAAGGIRSFQDVKLMVAAGADRIGTSRGVEIMAEIPTDDPR